MFGWFEGEKKKAAAKQVQEHPMLDLALEDLQVKGEDVILDIGFGGSGAQALRRLVPLLTGGRLAGIETDKGALRQAIQDFSEEFTHFRVEFRDGVVSRIPFPDGHFTKVLSLDQMHTWINIDKSFDEINRVLAPGGLLVLVWSQPLDPDTQMGRPIVSQEDIFKFARAAGFHHYSVPRERVEGPWRYQQFVSRKP